MLHAYPRNRQLGNPAWQPEPPLGYPFIQDALPLFLLRHFSTPPAHPPPPRLAPSPSISRCQSWHLPWEGGQPNHLRTYRRQGDSLAPHCNTARSGNLRDQPLGRSGRVGSSYSRSRLARSLSAAAFALFDSRVPARSSSVLRQRCCLALAATCLAVAATSALSPARSLQKTFQTFLHSANAAHPSACSARIRVAHARALTGTLNSRS